MKIPATVITGFLGAGKTTLIRHLLTQANGHRLALIINEFGDVGIDRDLLLGCGVSGCAPGDIVELANGCICCMVADAFLPTMERLLSRAEPPQHIIVETSGLALPKPLVQAFRWPDVRARVTVDGVLAVVDAPAVAEGRFASGLAAAAGGEPPPHDDPIEELFEDQLLCADLVVVNKTDLMDRGTLAAVLADVRGRVRPGTPIVQAAHGRVDGRVALGLSAGAEDDVERRPSHHDGEDDDHDHDAFASLVADVGTIAEPALLEERIRHAATVHGVIRVKGFVDVPDKPMRHVVQAVGTRVERYYDRPWRPDEVRRSQLVVIGPRDLDPTAVEQALRGPVPV